jgi:hypothetical protein
VIDLLVAVDEQTMTSGFFSHLFVKIANNIQKKQRTGGEVLAKKEESQRG